MKHLKRQDGRLFLLWQFKLGGERFLSGMNRGSTCPVNRKLCSLIRWGHFKVQDLGLPETSPHWLSQSRLLVEGGKPTWMWLFCTSPKALVPLSLWNPFKFVVEEWTGVPEQFPTRVICLSVHLLSAWSRRIFPGYWRICSTRCREGCILCS